VSADPVTPYIPFKCGSCQENTLTGHELYMVHDRLWTETTGLPLGDGTHLCVGCFEEKLGRELVAGDFADHPCNLVDRTRSPRLEARLVAS
jgi:hypothetical protein